MQFESGNKRVYCHPTCSFVSILSVDNFTLQWQSWAVATDKKTKLFTVWPFIASDLKEWVPNHSRCLWKQVQVLVLFLTDSLPKNILVQEVSCFMQHLP